MSNPDIPANSFIADDEENQEQLHQPFIAKHCTSDGTNEDGDPANTKVHSSSKSIGRVVYWTFFSLLLVVQFNMGLQHSQSSNSLHLYTVNWCIGLWVIASRLFRKTIADGSSTGFHTIPEVITCVLVIMVAVGWLECAFLVMVASITVLSLCVVIQSLYSLAGFSPDTDTAAERNH